MTLYHSRHAISAGQLTSSGHDIAETMENHWKNNISHLSWDRYEILMKPVKNEHSRWSVFGKVTPRPDCSMCRCVRHRAPRATRCGNTHFRSNALVAPSGRLRRFTGRLYHKYCAESAGIPCLGRYSISGSGIIS